MYGLTVQEGGAVYTLDIMFVVMKDDWKDETGLNVNVDVKTLNKLISGDTENIDLMKIYRYAEAMYPNKARGMVESDEGIF